MRTRWIAASVLGALVVLGVTCREARGCDCAWAGPFLQVAPRAVAVVRGVVVSHQGQSRVGPASMDVRVIETLAGDAGRSPVRVWGSDGAMCRPTVSQFPIGTEWILALNGPGSKPGMTPDYAVSNCGAYWLKVEGGEAVGNIDEERQMDAVQRLPLAEFKRRFAAMRAGLTPRRETFGETIDGPDARRPPTPAEIKRISEDGSGVLKIIEARVARSDPAHPPRFESLHFSVELTWRPAAFTEATR